jgi:hypothetical protein
MLLYLNVSIASPYAGLATAVIIVVATTLAAVGVAAPALFAAAALESKLATAVYAGFLL